MERDSPLDDEEDPGSTHEPHAPPPPAHHSHSPLLQLPVVRSDSGASTSLFGSDDSRSTTSSGDMSSSSGEIPPAFVADSVLPKVVARPTGATGGDDGGGGSAGGGVLCQNRCVGRRRAVSWGSASLLGRRREMEDALAVVPGFMSPTCEAFGGCTAPGSRTSAEISPVHFFGVYDGHGGSQVARFCAERMHEVVAGEWDKGGDEGGWCRRWEEAFFNGFGRVDNDVAGESIAPDMVGSTAVTVVVSSCQIIASNCGDSRAVLCRGSQTIPLTIDHKPDREGELARIEENGGRVINWNGPRVLGVLAMSRAIGDHYLRPWIIPVPETTFTARTEEDECLIVATDGLWDVMSSEEVGEVTRQMLRRHRRLAFMENKPLPAQAVAERLVELAYHKNSSDNISVIVVDLKAKRKRLHQRQ
ncbi:probable protein phosphatase 2C 6 [Aristolochia californica]|uniref:probable protein phosphatase 2C 6 n=1 Tax=Aristolochia californica TaxID=171875 RepID=UPI0035E2DF01